MTFPLRFTPLITILTLGACATIPNGPSVMVLPGSNKSFEQFRVDDSVCRQYAFEQIGGTTPNQTSVDSGVKSAAVGAALGAVAGAAIGGHQGAGVGAGTGLLVGGLAGAGVGESSGYGSQRRYDNAFVQCMYAKGHRVPVFGRLTDGAPRASSPPPPPPSGTVPPPPPGNPPPPPPGVSPR